MKQRPKTKKELYFKYRDSGLPGDCKEIMRLSLRPRTRRNYDYQWKRLHGLLECQQLEKLEAEEEGIISLAPEPGANAGKTPEVVTPHPAPVMKPPPTPRAAIPEDGKLIEEIDDEEPEETDADETAGRGKGEKVTPKKEVPGTVVGEGLTFAVTISVKTLMFYQHACSRISEPLSFGDFVDACVEDAYTGRGYDLGLVRVGGNGHAKERIPDDVRG
jgi:hypothetical protein